MLWRHWYQGFNYIIVTLLDTLPVVHKSAMARDTSAKNQDERSFKLHFFTPTSSAKGHHICRLRLRDLDGRSYYLSVNLKFGGDKKDGAWLYNGLTTYTPLALGHDMNYATYSKP